jgi:hypothetical protein
MNYEELSHIWNSNDIELNKSLEINKKLVKELSLTKVKSHLVEIKWSAIIELILNMVFINFFIQFIVNHIAELKFMLLASILLTIIVIGFIVEIKRLVLYFSIDSKSTVLDAQTKLAKLKKLELLERRSLYFVIPLFSLPFIIVVAKALLGIDLFEFNTDWMISYGIGSFCIAALIAFLMKKFPNKELQDSIEFLNELKNEGSDE